MSNQILSGLKREAWLKNFNDGFIAIDSSSFSNIDCDRKAKWAVVDKIVPAGGRAPLIFGHMIHELLEWQLKTGKPIDYPSFMEEAEHIINRTERGEEKTNGARLNACMDERRNVQEFLNLASSYCFNIKSKGDWIKPFDLEGELLVEKSFSLPLGTIEVQGKKVVVLWEGKMDVIGHCTRSGKLSVADHKTTSILGNKFLDDKMRGVQFHGYLFAASEMLKPLGLVVEDVLLNVMCKRKDGYEFQTMRFSRPQHQVQEWRQETLSALQVKFNSILLHLQNNTTPLGNRNFCCQKFGQCEFFQVCELNPSIRNTMLFDLNYFQISNWSALNA